MKKLVNYIRPLPLLILAQIILFFFLYFSPQLSFQHVETQLFNDCAFRDEPVLTLMSPVRFFSRMGCLETDSRSRAFNMALLGLNSHLRLALFDRGILHPSLSMNWLIGIFLCPLALFFLGRLLFLSEWISLAVSALFLVSVGNLSSFLQLFHPGKSFTTLAIILCLYLIKILQETKENRGFFLLALLIFLGGQSDETFYILPLVLPFFYPDLVVHCKKHLKLNLVIFSGFLFNLFFLTFIYPKLGPLLLGDDYNYSFDFWRYAFGSNEDLHHFDKAWVITNFFETINGHFSAAFQNRIGLAGVWGPSALLAAALGVILLFARGRRMQLLRYMLMVPLYVVLQTVILTRRGGVLNMGPYYWGILGSLFICLLLGFVLAAFKMDRNWKKISAVTVILFLLAGFWNNSLILNQRNIDSIILKSDLVTGCNWDYDKIMSDADPATVRSIWENRFSENSVAMADTLPRQYFWFKYELVIWRWQNKLSEKLTSCRHQ